MKRALDLADAVREALSQTALGLRAAIIDTLLDLAEEPEPLGARPYGGIPDAFELRTDAFRLVYTRGAEHVSVWILQINT
ncbi:mRNA-degrading endonuclease RelE of RelBE toxin-antitoxin system [Streptosporangium album]|uniref:mRNA-degrading endonuclease RelE of RelBE toxin-antitoxin system n=1 Tax=Streptosporangium album TaxID=47479 RepID=A0A7W7S4Z5_9ACTN|nr:type II toxin-antitoxin system RelE/ParE family toxin [Streptosporangium album]MBB4943627.1 mRNA-degrading endonuclease RelE of RelBE toxin-antitoxin system [Streptosporangium album]